MNIVLSFFVFLKVCFSINQRIGRKVELLMCIVYLVTIVYLLTIGEFDRIGESCALSLY